MTFEEVEDLVNNCTIAFGKDFVEWAVNGSIETGSELSNDQLGALTFIGSFAARVNSETSSVARNFARTNLTTPASITGEPFDESPLTKLRRATGGTLPSASSTDPAKAALRQLCIDIYPATLMTWEPDRMPNSIRFRTTNYKGARDFARAALLEDEPLAEFFPGHSLVDVGEPVEFYSVSSYVSWRSGHGGTMQLIQLPDALLVYSLSICEIKGDSSLEPFMDECALSLDLVRRLATGAETQIVAAATLSNIDTSNSSPINISSVGNVYSWPLDREPPLFSSTGMPVSAVLLTSFTEKLLYIVPQSTFDPQNVPERDLDVARKAHDDFRSNIDRARLSFLLASQADAVVAPVLCAWSPLDPTAPAQSHQFSPNYGAPLPEATVSPFLGARIEEWSSRIEGATTSLDIGIRRLISATTARTDELDGLIDAVMCWENIFGDTPETAFKVCGALSLLLEPNSIETRASLFRRLKQIYDARSALVHGVKEPKATERHLLRKDAIDVALRALRLVLVNGGIMECKSSAERSKYVLLGFAK